MQITVRDTGIGIPEAQHREIFEAFEQEKAVRAGPTVVQVLGSRLSVIYAPY